MEVITRDIQKAESWNLLHADEVYPAASTWQALEKPALAVRSRTELLKERIRDNGTPDRRFGER